MRAAGLDYEHRELVVRDAPVPATPTGDRVLLRIHEVGVCGTDRELARFHFGYPPPGESFLTLGHEALGKVVAAGAEVTRFRPGDWAVPLVRRACEPACPSCARGRRDLCVSGRYIERGIFGLHGYLCEYAADAESDLVAVPAALCDVAVLAEPLSVVEKAIAMALHIHEPDPRTALVLGAGPIGMLAALALQLRGFDVAVHSLESPGHPRARLLTSAGVRYLESLEGEQADIVLEATGSAAAVFAGFRALAPLGVYGVIGGPNSTGEVPFLDMMRHNQALFGTVNASPAAFALACEDLGRMDRAIVSRMIHRARFDTIRETLTAPPGEAAKIVHMAAD